MIETLDPTRYLAKTHELRALLLQPPIEAPTTLEGASMASAPPQRSHGHHRPARTQMRFVPKSNSSASSAAVSDHPKPTPPLTTSLRGSTPPTTRSRDQAKLIDSGGLSFVNYLPQDEAVASGLGAGDGGVDAEESQRVVDILNEELSQLLKMTPRDFWREGLIHL